MAHNKGRHQMNILKSYFCIENETFVESLTITQVPTEDISPKLHDQMMNNDVSVHGLDMTAQAETTMNLQKKIMLY